MNGRTYVRFAELHGHTSAFNVQHICGVAGGQQSGRNIHMSTQYVWFGEHFER